MAKKKKQPVVNIDARVSRRIRSEQITKTKKGKPKVDLRTKELREYIKRESRGKRKLVSDEKYERMSDEMREKHVPVKEAERKFLEEKHDWFYRFQPVAGSGYKKKVPGIKTDKQTGEKSYVERSRTFYRWRDKTTGRFISYTNTKIIRDKETGKLIYVPVDHPKGKSVKDFRYEMRKEATIYKIAERKRISIEDARRIFEEFEDEGMARYLMKEYAETP